MCCRTAYAKVHRQSQYCVAAAIYLKVYLAAFVANKHLTCPHSWLESHGKRSVGASSSARLRCILGQGCVEAANYEVDVVDHFNCVDGVDIIFRVEDFHRIVVDVVGRIIVATGAEEGSTACRGPGVDTGTPRRSTTATLMRSPTQRKRQLAGRRMRPNRWQGPTTRRKKTPVDRHAGIRGRQGGKHTTIMPGGRRHS